MEKNNLQHLHFLIVGFTGKTVQVESALKLGIKLSLLIGRGKYKPEYKDSFSQVLIAEDIYNWHEVKEIIDKSEKIDVVLTRSEDHVNVVGAINQYLGLDGMNYVTARNFCNKYLMKQKWLEARVSCADGICLDDISQLDRFLEKYHFPLMLKKTSAVHSNFVIKVSSKEDLLEKLKFLKERVDGEVVSKSVAGYDDKIRACQFLLEEMLGGRELTVDTFVVDNCYTHTPICEYTMAHELNIDDTYLPIRTMPTILTKEQEELIYQTVEQALGALHAKNCVCHTEVFFDERKNECAIIESTPRSGGNRAEMTLSTTGFDYSLAVFKATAGYEVGEVPKPTSAISVVEYFAERKGILTNLNLDFLYQNPAVKNIKVKYMPGDLVEQAKFGGKPIISFFVKKSNPLESQKLAKVLFQEIRSAIKINYVE